MGALYRRRRTSKRGVGALVQKILQQQETLALTFTHTPPQREEGTGSGSLCLRTPERKKVGKQEKDRERESGGLGPSKNSLD